MKRGAFLNSQKANCSIYESGLMIYDILKSSEHYELDYFETDAKLTQYNKFKKPPYDFHIINWHPHTLAIPQAQILKLSARTAIVVEVGPSKREYTPFTPAMFDAYAIIDPTKDRYNNYFPLPRPILRFPTRPLLDENKLVFGSFGLFSHQFKHEKKFEEIIEAANSSKKECIVRINLPIPKYTSTSIETIKEYGNWLKSLAKSNVDVRMSYDYMSRDELVGWLSEHNINCFPYYRERPGLAAVADQAIAAGRAIMTTECNTFRHLHQHIGYYPKESYEELLKSTVPGVLKMRDLWSPDNFRTEFNNMLREMKIA